MKRHYIAETHLGLFEKWAASAKKAIANIRYRLTKTGCNCPTTYRKAWEA